MVTAPLHKGVIIEGGYPHFTGHTEWLRDACGVDEVVMLLATDARAACLRRELAGQSRLTGGVGNHAFAAARGGGCHYV